MSRTHERSPRRRLLVVSHGTPTTGYGRVVTSLCPHWREHFDILHFGLNCRTMAAGAGWRSVANTLPGDPFGRLQLPPLLDEFRPDLLFLLHDPGMLAVHLPALAEYRARNLIFRTVVYCPVEWRQTPPGNLADLAAADLLVFYTEFGRAVARDAFRTLGIAPGQPLAVIPHGIDTAVFRPLDPEDPAAGRRRARAALFPDRPELQQAFIVLSGNRNVPRKRLDLALQAFARFAAGKAGVFFYLHAGPRDVGFDLTALAEELGISDRLLFTPCSGRRPEVSEEMLNTIYNAGDVGLTTSTGEGWGLTACEHAAVGAPQIVPDHSACAELWRGRGVLIDLDENDDEPGRISVPAAAAALERLYAEPGLRRELGRSAREFVTRPEFSWAAVAERWRAEMTALVPAIQT